jgi:hypothetical protein
MRSVRFRSTGEIVINASGSDVSRDWVQVNNASHDAFEFDDGRN